MAQNIWDELMIPPSEGMQPAPWYLDMMESIPTLSASVGALGLRGGNTILGGGWRERAGMTLGAQTPVGLGGYLREGLQHHNPARMRTWTRMADQRPFHHTGQIAQTVGGKRLGVYNPFYASQAINWAGRKMGARAKAKGSTHWMWGSEGSELMTKGFYSRVSAAGRIGWMTNSRWDRVAAGGGPLAGGAAGPARAGQLAQFLTDAGLPGGNIVAQGRTASQQAILMSGTGTLTGRVGGFMAGALGPVTHGAYAGAVASGKMSAAAVKGAEIATRWATDVAKAGGATKGGLSVAGKAAALTGARIGLLAAPGINVAMMAWLAYDVARLATKGVGHIAKTGIEAHRSLEGGMRTGIMMQEFRDNEVTRSSRARGVMAIQNSRLNARSILGNEASAMAAHFG